MEHKAKVLRHRCFHSCQVDCDCCHHYYHLGHNNKDNYTSVANNDNYNTSLWRRVAFGLTPTLSTEAQFLLRIQLLFFIKWSLISMSTRKIFCLSTLLTFKKFSKLQLLFNIHIWIFVKSLGHWLFSIELNPPNTQL